MLAQLLDRTPSHPTRCWAGWVGTSSRFLLPGSCDADRGTRHRRRAVRPGGPQPRYAVRDGAAAGDAEHRGGPAATAPTDDTLLLAHADLAMYQAKREGRNRARLFAPEQQRLAAERVTRGVAGPSCPGGPGSCNWTPSRSSTSPSDQVSQLRAADAGAGKASSRPIGPGEFLPALERGDMIYELDRWGGGDRRPGRSPRPTRPGCTAALRRQHLPAARWRTPSFGGWVVDTLTAAGVPATQLGLEITETTAIGNLDGGPPARLGR